MTNDNVTLVRALRRCAGKKVRISFMSNGGTSMYEIVGADDTGIVIRSEGHDEYYVPWHNIALIALPRQRAEEGAAE